MTVCKFDTSTGSDMYGLGIRLGYYLQWLGIIFAAWMAPSEVKSLRFSIDLFVAATFLALVILTTKDVSNLEPVETYIILLLTFGAYLALVPIYLWRLLTGCDPYYDPTRYPIVNPGTLAANLSFMLLIAVLIFQYWFWFARVPVLGNYNCQQYGFLLSQMRLNSKASVAINALMYFFLGLVCLYLLTLKIRHILGFPDPIRNRKRRVVSRRRKEMHIRLLQNMDGWFKLIVAIMVIMAVELTISWNEIKGVNSLASAGQTIPFFIGIGAVVRVLYVYLFTENDDESDISSDDDSHVYAHRGPPMEPIPERQLPNTKYRRVLRTPQQAYHGYGRPMPVRQQPHPYARR